MAKKGMTPKMIRLLLDAMRRDCETRFKSMGGTVSRKTGNHYVPMDKAGVPKWGAMDLARACSVFRNLPKTPRREWLDLIDLGRAMQFVGLVDRLKTHEMIKDNRSKGGKNSTKHRRDKKERDKLSILAEIEIARQQFPTGSDTLIFKTVADNLVMSEEKIRKVARSKSA